ncbi:MAG: transposase [Paenibacillus sp.]|nr:transposase [Paenibacillus sp.]
MFKVSRSGYYKWRSAEVSEQCKHKEEVTTRIKWHFQITHEIYGSPRIHKELLKEGLCVSERTVSLIMREQGLRSCMARKFRVQTTDSNHDQRLLQISFSKILQQQSQMKNGWLILLTFHVVKESSTSLVSWTSTRSKLLDGN